METKRSYASRRRCSDVTAVTDNVGADLVPEPLHVFPHSRQQSQSTIAVTAVTPTRTTTSPPDRPSIFLLACSWLRLLPVLMLLVLRLLVFCFRFY